nr:Chain M, Cell division control protein 42 homolog (Cdc42) [synthetic construct]1TNZ_N Chain N, Cell division control protein 42 homolog (Cdc42) [synthetic construct]1TNZ_O Chain O, Cell division control protein 42 homolog (Cdc42) [synthetic construct]1TNZ_P Chain P, Cell division control protein 42 homolog (Cdc42) [synthetic construct]1TNZ_Q Chain Q, Cell division control protein 42 homolog (Cdc42) [synthetic construct]1TNZ_R Chain R, Cell division control protein 42 homolog (Cdc42) [synthe
RRCVLL